MCPVPGSGAVLFAAPATGLRHDSTVEIDHFNTATGRRSASGINVNYACGMNRLPLLAVVTLAGCTGTPSEPDALRVLGKWVVVDFHSPGAAEDRGQRRKLAIVTEGTWSEQFQGDRFEDFEYALDASKTPKELDLTFTGPDGKRLTVRAIYELIDDDRLRVCLGSPPIVLRNGQAAYVESERPVTFEAKDRTVISYHRATR